MFKPISLYIGLRYTRARRSNHFISFIALVSMIGLTLGVAVLITVLSVMNGFDRELKNRVLGMIPQATVSSTQILTDWPVLAKKIEQHKHVTGVAPFTQLQGMLTAQGQVAGIMVTGIEPQYEKKVSIIQNHMVEGSIDQLKKGEYGIVLGKQMTDALGLGLNDNVTLVLPEATPSPAGVVPRFKRFKIVGIFSIGAEVDSSLGYIALNDASTLLRLPDGAQGVRMKLDDIFQAPQVANEIVRELPNGFYASDWTYTHGNLFSAIQMEKAMVSLLLFLIVLVAAFNIVSSLVMVVTDKKSDIAILRTLGASPATITRIFMVQGTVIGVVGTVAGAILGIISALGISHFIGWLNTAFGFTFIRCLFYQLLTFLFKMARCRGDCELVLGSQLYCNHLPSIGEQLKFSLRRRFVMNSATQSPVVLEAQNIYKSFTDGKSHVDVITGLSLQVAQGEFVSIVGSSGSGKSTLLHILGGLDRPTQGLVNLNGRRFDNLGEAERGFLRNEHLGFVYQFHHLLPEFTALENVAMPLMLRKDAEYKKVKERAEYLLERVGLSHRLTHQPGELSGGERQRVALARALVTQPKLMLADEPTGNLDRKTAKSIFELLRDLREEFNMAMLIVTHDEQLAKSADKILHMQDGVWIDG